MEEALSPAQQQAVAQMREVLQDDYLELRVTGYALREDFDAGTATVEATIAVNGDPPFEVRGTGVGLIDAFFDALRARFSPEYPSLESIRFSSFSIRGPIGTAQSRQASDARAEARVGITNSYGGEFDFAAVTESVSRSSTEAVASAVQYFVNSERAYVTMYRALQHYRSEGRTDLVSKYTGLLAEMVKNTSYSSAVERLEREG